MSKIFRLTIGRLKATGEGEGAGGAGAGAAGDAGAAGAGAGAGSVGAGEAGGTGATPKTYDEAHVTKLNNECAERRLNEKKLATELATIKSELKKHQDEKLTDSEKLNNKVKELEEALTKANQGTADAALLLQVAEAGVVGANIKRVMRMVSGHDDVAKELDALKKDMPNLFKAGGAVPPGRSDQLGAAGAGKNAELGVSINEAIRHAARGF